MLTVSVPVAEMVEHGRLDPEYFSPAHRDLEFKLSRLNSVPLGTLGSFTCSAFYPAATHLYDADGVPFIRCVDLVDYPIVTPDQPFVRIPNWFVSSHGSIRTAKEGDIIISKVGTPCYASLLGEGIGTVALTRTVLGMLSINKDKVDPRYLVAFLRSSIGFSQLMRERELTIQYQLTLERVRKVKVFLPDPNVQREIGDQFDEYHMKAVRSKTAFNEAQSLLESELGLDKLTFDKPVSYAARFSEVSLSQAIAANRIDAQCFSPSAIQYEQVLSNLPAVQPLRYLTVAMAKGAQQDESTYGTVPYVSIKHIQNSEVLTDRKSKAFRGMPLARKGDVLLALTGSIGKVGVVSRYDELTFSGDVLSITAKNIDPYYLVAVLSDRIGQVQLMRWITGSNQGHLAPRDVGRVLIPRLDEKVEARIASLMKESIDKTHESARLLDQAKRRVEELIEETITA